MDNYCHVCGNKGKPGGCPACGRKEGQFVKLTLNAPIEMIPIQYQGKTWESPTEGSQVSRQFNEKLEKVLTLFQKGDVPKFSMFIGSPAKEGKHLFAYSCMQSALMAGYSSAPLFTTSDWRRLYRVSQTNPMYKLYGQYQWDHLVKMDVVFLSVDHSSDRYDCIALLKDIYDTRAAFNLPTFVISDFKLNELVPGWDKKQYSLIYNPDPNRDTLRYPVVLHNFET